MADLRALLTGFGCRNIRSVLASGNLVFTTVAAASEIERLLETELQRELGLRSDVFVRAEPEWRSLVAANPFPVEAARDPAHVVAMVLRDVPEREALEDLQRSVRGPELIRARGDTLYITYPAGIGDSKLTNAAIEKKLGTRGTARNWNTVCKLATLAEELL